MILGGWSNVTPKQDGGNESSNLEKANLYVLALSWSATFPPHPYLDKSCLSRSAPFNRDISRAYRPLKAFF